MRRVLVYLGFIGGRRRCLTLSLAFAIGRRGKVAARITSSKLSAIFVWAAAIVDDLVNERVAALCRRLDEIHDLGHAGGRI